jgi:hypothetical protein
MSTRNRYPKLSHRPFTDFKDTSASATNQDDRSEAENDGDRRRPLDLFGCFDRFSRRGGDHTREAQSTLSD